MKKILTTLSIILFISLILGLSVRGVPGNPSAQKLNTPELKEGGPFELSPERGRFALLYSVVEDKSFYYSTDVAKFTLPDLATSHGKNVSLFAPGVSYAVMPGYILGKLLGASQVGTFAVVALFALFNFLLIVEISQKLGVNKYASILGGIAFLFGSPAFAYAVTLYQHHISTFLILLSVYILVRFKGLWTLSLIWFLFALSFLIDNPNLFLMLPIALFSLTRLFVFEKDKVNLKIRFNFLGILTFVTVVFPIGFLLWFNNASYSNPFQLSGTVATARYIADSNTPDPNVKFVENSKFSVGPNEEIEKDKNAVGFFKTRNLMHGLYIHTLSPDRGIIYFAPVILFGIWGMFTLYVNNPNVFSMLLGVVFVNVALYSMWGDPYGGWAFGSRYLIPTYAIFGIFIAQTLDVLRKNYLLLALFFVTLVYSVLVNSLGALTTNANPPKEEIAALEKVSGFPQKYSFDRNVEYLVNQGTKSFAYQAIFKSKMDPVLYYSMVVSLIISAQFAVLMLNIISKTHEKI